MTNNNANERQHGGEHYKGAEYQHWDWVNDLRMPYLPGNASKYVFRWRKKNGVVDLEKGIHYLDKCMESHLTACIGNNRAELFWKLVIQNNVHMVDAMVLWYIMEGQFGAAREVLLGVLEGLRAPVEAS